MFKKSMKTTVILFLITILFFSLTTTINAAGNYTTIIIKSNGGTNGVGRIEVGQSQMMILSPAIPAPGTSITGYAFNGVKYFNTNGNYTNGKWSSAETSIVVEIQTQTATKKCSKCSELMTYHSANGSECSWKHPSNTCEYSDAVCSETHSWASATCVIKPYCKYCYTEQPGSLTNGNHANLEIVKGVCSDNGGNIPYKHCAACDTYFKNDGTTLANKNAVVRKEKGHTWTDEEWVWTVNNDNTASYVLHVECSNCGKVVDYSSTKSITPTQSDKTVKPNCTTDGANYYTAEVVYEGTTFSGEYTSVIPAHGHSFAKDSNPKWTIAIDELGKSYHFHKCVNSDCPDKGIVDATSCEATGENVATCGKASICDICKTTFGDVLQHDYENGECKLCKVKCETHDWSEGICKICKFAHEEHKWKEGICEECGFSSEEHEWENGICKECQAKHENHIWEKGECRICQLKHDHKIWKNGICEECNMAHMEHDWNNGQCKTCYLVHDEHEWENGACTVCTFKCEHTMVGATCTICKFAEYKVFLSSTCVFNQGSNESVVYETNGTHDKFVAILINGVKVPRGDLAISDGRIIVMHTYLDNLPLGEHKVVIQYEDGEVSSSVIINEAVGLDGPGKVGKIILIVALAALGIAVGTGAIILYIYKIRRDDEYYDDDEDYYEDDDEDDDPPPPPSRPRTIAENVAARKAPPAPPPAPPQQATRYPQQTARYPQQISLTTEEERAILDKVNREMKIDIDKILNED